MNIKKHMRANQDIVARYGGEEFVLVFIDMKLDQVIKRLKNIKQEFATQAVFEDQHITMSFGLVELKSYPSLSADELIEQADKKLYEAKNTGRNRIVF